MGLLLTGGFVFRNGRFENLDVAIDQGRIVSVSPSLPFRIRAGRRSAIPENTAIAPQKK